MADKNNSDPVGQDVDIYSILKDTHMQKKPKELSELYLARYSFPKDPSWETPDPSSDRTSIGFTVEGMWNLLDRIRAWMSRIKAKWERNGETSLITHWFSIISIHLPPSSEVAAGKHFWSSRNGDSADTTVSQMKENEFCISRILRLIMKYHRLGFTFCISVAFPAVRRENKSWIPNTIKTICFLKSVAFCTEHLKFRIIGL